MLRLRAEVDARDVVLDLEVRDGETVAVLGPNGAGKSTLLELVAGLLRADRGSAELDGVPLFDAERRWHLPPHRRRIALLTQQPSLFPHLSVLGNVRFGAHSGGLRGAAADADALALLDAVGAAALAGVSAAEVSGGEAQRIALARALAARPRLVLLDEPLSALDAAAAPAIRRMLRWALADRSAVLVTHDPVDAWTLADRVLVLEAGRVVEAGATARVLGHPGSAFAAELVGLSLLHGTSTITGIRLADGRELPVSAGVAAGRAVVATVRPSGVRIVREGGIRARVTALEARGEVLRVRTDLVAADTPPEWAGWIDEGAEVLLEIDPAAVHVREKTVQ